MDYKKNQKYFKESSKKGPIICIVIGAILLAIGRGAIIIGLLLIAAGIGIIVLQIKGKVSDEEYDASVISQLDNMKQRALDKLGIDEDEVTEIAPISISGYNYNSFNNAKKGKDSRWRTDRYKYAMLFFSANEVHCYTYNYRTTADEKTEATDVYFYKDIVSVSTASETVKIYGQDYNYETFKLTTAGGTALTISVRDMDNVQRSVNAMRQLLRQKKQA